MSSSMEEKLEKIVSGAKLIGISGHVHPDGDCVGAVLGCTLYLKKVLGDSVQIYSYLEGISKSLSMLNGLENIDTEYHFPDRPFDLFISLDCGSSDRLGRCEKAFLEANGKIVFDHHITNAGFGDVNFVYPSASSTCEVIFDFLDEKQIDLSIAEALYVGIMHDTGVFKYSCTSERTMCIVGRLMSKGIDTADLIDRTYFIKSFLQLKTLGFALNKAKLGLDGKLISTVLTLNDLEKLGAAASDTESIVSQIRTTEGVEVAVFIREDEPGLYKFSLRSNGKVDVAGIAASFGGGGHKLAAGFSIKADLDETFTQISAMVMFQL